MSVTTKNHTSVSAVAASVAVSSAPVSTATGDYLLAEVTAVGATALTASPAGYVLVQAQTAGTGLYHAIWAKFATSATDGTGTWTATGATSISVTVTGYSGVSATTPVRMKASTSATGAISITPTNAIAQVGDEVLVLTATRAGPRPWPDAGAGCLFGAQPNNSFGNWVSQTGVATMEGTIQRSLAHGHSFAPWDMSTFPTAGSGTGPNVDLANNRLSFISWFSDRSYPPAGSGYTNATNPITLLTDFNNGRWDSIIFNNATAMKNFAHPLIFRLFCELNGGDHPYEIAYTQSGTSINTATWRAQFLPAWKRIWAITKGSDADIASFAPGYTLNSGHSANAQNVFFHWCPQTFESTSMSRDAMYPGDQFVDIAGSELYTKPSTTDTATNVITDTNSGGASHAAADAYFSPGVTAGVNGATGSAGGKPVGSGESGPRLIGADTDTTASNRIASFLTAVKNHIGWAIMSWWEGGSYASNNNSNIESYTPAQKAAVVSMVGDAYMNPILNDTFATPGGWTEIYQYRARLGNNTNYGTGMSGTQALHQTATGTTVTAPAITAYGYGDTSAITVALVPSGGGGGGGGGSTAVVMAAGDLLNTNENNVAAFINSNYYTNDVASGFVVMGDNAYNDGSQSDFTGNFEPAYGAMCFKNSRQWIFPSTGSHDFGAWGAGGAVGNGATGYKTYFSGTKGMTVWDSTPNANIPYNSFYYHTGTVRNGPGSNPAPLLDVTGNPTSWCIINVCGVKGVTTNVDSDGLMVALAAGSPQNTWLSNALTYCKNNGMYALIVCGHAFYTADCSGAGGGHAPEPKIKPVWDLLNSTGMLGRSIVLGGHNHNYQRFVPQDNNSNAVASTAGTVQFVVGTGGLSGGYTADNTPANWASLPGGGNAYTAGIHGALELTLTNTGYSFRFINSANSSVFDSGTVTLAALSGGGGSAPTNSVLPAVTPTTGLTVGAVLSSTQGTWLNTPTSFAYQWYRVSTGTAVIAGATASTYTAAAADVGFDLECRVTATNASGSTTAISNITSVVASSSTSSLPNTTPNANAPQGDGNDVLKAIHILGSIYVAGSFLTFGGSARNHFAAYSENNALLPWNPNADGDGFKIIPGPSGKVFVSGGFNTINGVARSKVALISSNTSLASPTVDTTFNPPTINAGVYGLAYDATALSGDGALYLAGDFTSVGGSARTYFACLNARTGALQPWAPSITQVNNAYHPGRRVMLGKHATDQSSVYLNGAFDFVQGQARTGIACVDKNPATASPAVAAWAPDVRGHAAGTDSGTQGHDIDIKPDGTQIICAFSGGGTGFDGNHGVCWTLVQGGVLSRQNTRNWTSSVNGDSGDHNSCACDDTYAFFGHHGGGLAGDNTGFGNPKCYGLKWDGTSSGWVQHSLVGAQGVYTIDLTPDRMIVGGNLTAPRTGLVQFDRTVVAPPPTHPQIGVVVFENASRATALAQSKLASLDATYASYTAYQGTSAPSLPDYMAMASGQYSGKGTFGGSPNGIDTGSIGFAGSQANIMAQLATAGFSWKAYEEGVSVNGYNHWGVAGDANYSTALYLARHCPAAHYTTTSAAGTAHGNGRYDFDELATDIANQTLPDFFYVTPNAVHDGHDNGLAPANTWLASGGAWGGIDNLIAALRPGGMLVIIFDNVPSGATSLGTGVVYCVIAGPNVSHSSVSTGLDHFSLLKAIQTKFGVSTFTAGVDSHYTSVPTLAFPAVSGGTVLGSGTGAFAITGQANGVAIPLALGTARATVAVTGQATGVVTSHFGAAGLVTFTGLAAGKATGKAQATSSVVITGLAAGHGIKHGTATSAINLTGSGVGVASNHGGGVTSPWKKVSNNGGRGNAVIPDPSQPGRALGCGDVFGHHTTENNGHVWEARGKGLTVSTSGIAPKIYGRTGCWSKKNLGTVYLGSGVLKGGTGTAATKLDLAGIDPWSRTALAGNLSFGTNGADPTPDGTKLAQCMPRIGTGQLLDVYYTGSGSEYLFGAHSGGISRWVDEGTPTSLLAGTFDGAALTTQVVGGVTLPLTWNPAWKAMIVNIEAGVPVIYAAEYGLGGYNGGVNGTATGQSGKVHRFTNILSGTPVHTVLANAPSTVTDFCQGPDGELYAVAVSHIYHVTNAGATWTVIDDGKPTGHPVASLDMTSISGVITMAAIMGGTPSLPQNATEQLLIGRLNGGVWTWTWMLASAVHSTEYNNGNTYWLATQTNCLGSSAFQGAQIRFDADGRSLYIAGTGGMWKTDDLGVNAYPAGDGFGGSECGLMDSQGVGLFTASDVDWKGQQTSNSWLTETKMSATPTNTTALTRTVNGVVYTLNPVTPAQFTRGATHLEDDYFQAACVAPNGIAVDAAGTICISLDGGGVLRYQVSNQVLGVARGAPTFTGLGAGRVITRGVGAGSVAFVATAAGNQSRSAVAQGSATFTGSATGRVTQRGVASATTGFIGSGIATGTGVLSPFWVQTNGSAISGTNASSLVVPITAAPAIGDMLSVSVQTNGLQTITSVTDTFGNTYAVDRDTDGVSVDCVRFVTTILAGVPTSVTVNISANSAQWVVQIDQWHGVTPGSPRIDSAVTAQATGTTTKPAVTSGSPATVSDLAIGLMGWHTGATPVRTIAASLPFTKRGEKDKSSGQFGSLSVFDSTLWGSESFDSFIRGASSGAGWGTSDSGDPWTLSTGTVGDTALTGTAGTLTIATANTSAPDIMTDGNIYTDSQLQVDLSWSTSATANLQAQGLVFRYQDANNFTMVELSENVVGDVVLELREVISGSIGGGLQSTSVAFVPGTMYTVKARLVGTRIDMKAWKVGTTEPVNWLSSSTISSSVVSGKGGVFARRNTGNTNAATNTFDNYAATDITGNTITAAGTLSGAVVGWHATVLGYKAGTHSFVTGIANSNVAFTGTAPGTIRARGVGAGSLAVTGSATGRGQMHGSAIGSLTFIGSATGSAQTHAVAHGTVAMTLAATGSIGTRAAATLSILASGKAAGTVQHHVFSGVAGGSVSLTGLAAGRATKKGSGALSVAYTGLAAGVAGHHVYQGVARGSIAVVGASQGHIVNHGVAAGTIAVTGAVFPTINGTKVGAGLLIPAIVGLAAGQKSNHAVTGSATGAITVVGAAPGRIIRKGTAVGAISITGTAASTITRHLFSGHAAGSVTFAGLVQGHGASSEGAGAGTMAVTGVANGIKSAFGEVNMRATGFLTASADVGRGNQFFGECHMTANGQLTMGPPRRVNSAYVISTTDEPLNMWYHSLPRRKSVVLVNFLDLALARTDAMSEIADLFTHGQIHWYKTISATPIHILFQGVATGVVDVEGLGIGKVTQLGEAAGTVNIVGRSGSTVTHHVQLGTAASSLRVVGAASGITLTGVVSGLGKATTSITGLAAGHRVSHGSAIGTVAVAGQAFGFGAGKGIGVISITGSVIGRVRSIGAGGGLVTVTGQAFGSTSHHTVSGSGSGSVTVTGQVAGIATARARGTITLLGNISGRAIGRGLGSGAVIFVGTGAGVALSSFPHTAELGLLELGEGELGDSDSPISSILSGMALGFVTFTGVGVGTAFSAITIYSSELGILELGDGELGKL